MVAGSQIEFSCEDRKWFEKLKSSRSGRVLQQHLAHVDALSSPNASPERKHSCPFAVYLYRVCLLAALKKDKTALGLPAQLPNVVAVVNLSGHRSILYSDHWLLARLLAGVGPECDPQTDEQVKSLISKAAKKGASLLICLVLPFQAGLESLCWEIRTLSRGEGLSDAGPSLRYGQGQNVRPAGDTLSTCEIESDVIRETQKSFALTMSAASVDVADSESDRFSLRREKEVDLIGVLQVELKKRTAELREVKEERDAAVLKNEQKCDARVAATIAKCDAFTAIQQTKENESNAQVSLLTHQLSDLMTANHSLTARAAQEDLLAQEEHRKLEQKLRAAEAAAKSAEQRAAAAARAAEKGRVTAAEKAAAALAAAAERAEAAERGLKAAEEANEELRHRSAALERLADAQKASNEVLTYEIQRFKRKTVAAHAALAFVRAAKPPPAPPPKDTDEAAVNTEPFVSEEVLKMEIEIGGLNEQIEKKDAEVASLKKQLAEVKRELKRAQRGAPPPGCTPDEPKVLGVPVEARFKGDVALEALVAQVEAQHAAIATSIQAIASVARSATEERAHSLSRIGALLHAN